MSKEFVYGKRTNRRRKEENLVITVSQQQSEIGLWVEGMATALTSADQSNTSQSLVSS